MTHPPKILREKQNQKFSTLTILNGPLWVSKFGCSTQSWTIKPNSNYKSKFEQHKTAGFVQAPLYWPDAKITGLGPVVQCKVWTLVFNPTGKTSVLILSQKRKEGWDAHNALNPKCNLPWRTFSALSVIIYQCCNAIIYQPLHKSLHISP